MAYMMVELGAVVLNPKMVVVKTYINYLNSRPLSTTSRLLLFMGKAEGKNNEFTIWFLSFICTLSLTMGVNLYMGSFLSIIKSLI